MPGWSMNRILVSVFAVLIVFPVLSMTAQTPDSDFGRSEGKRSAEEPTQRDIVTASNADAFLLTDEYPRVDVAFNSGDLTCYRLIESPGYEGQRTVTLDLTWCLNARNGLMSAVSENWAFPEDIKIQGAFCGWNSTMGELETGTISCKVLISEEQCGPPKTSCINDEMNWAFHGDGRWERMDEWDIRPYSYDASKAYPLSD